MKTRKARQTALDTLEVSGETVRLGALTVITGTPTACTRVTDALADQAVHVGVELDRGDAIARALLLAGTQGRVVTVDTFEYGLHYTELVPTLEALWDDAAKHAVQVVVTTQSAEMVEALDDLAVTRPGADVRLTKCGAGLGEAPSLGPDEIRIAVKQRLEVR